MHAWGFLDYPVRPGTFSCKFRSCQSNPGCPLGGLNLVYIQTHAGKVNNYFLLTTIISRRKEKHTVGVVCFSVNLSIRKAYYARFADFRFAVFFEAFFADRFFDDFLAALFFAAIKIFLLCKQRVIDKKFFMITTMTITLYIQV
jgi:hypothetical protein